MSQRVNKVRHVPTAAAAAPATRQNREPFPTTVSSPSFVPLTPLGVHEAVFLFGAVVQHVAPAGESLHENQAPQTLPSQRNLVEAPTRNTTQSRQVLFDEGNFGCCQQLHSLVPFTNSASRHVCVQYVLLSPPTRRPLPWMRPTKKIVARHVTFLAGSRHFFPPPLTNQGVPVPAGVLYRTQKRLRCRNRILFSQTLLTAPILHTAILFS